MQNWRCCYNIEQWPASKLRLYVAQENACVADGTRIADIDFCRSCVDILTHRKVEPKPFTGETKRCLETLPFMVSKEPLCTLHVAPLQKTFLGLNRYFHESSFEMFYASFDSRTPRNLSAFKAVFVVIISLVNL